MAGWWNRPRFDLVELSAVGAFAALAVTSLLWVSQARLAYVVRSAAQEADQLKERYGPGRYSRNEEEWIIRDYFQDRRGGYFVDVGANHYRNDSNTFYLEKRLGWSGLAIDPQTSFADDYRRYRPHTRFLSFFISDSSNASVKLYVVDQNPLVASMDQKFAERNGTEAKNAVNSSRPVSVPAIRLTDLLEQIGVSRFDLLSVDVELAEPKVLAGFDIDRFRPSLVCIEAHPQVRQPILDYFANHGYVVLGRYLRADLQNLYFAPLRTPTPPTAR
jgi:FkbM family methyltransferase